MHCVKHICLNKETQLHFPGLGFGSNAHFCEFTQRIFFKIIDGFSGMFLGIVLESAYTRKFSRDLLHWRGNGPLYGTSHNRLSFKLIDGCIFISVGIVLVSAYTSDLGDALEAASGYFNRPWQWEVRCGGSNNQIDSPLHICYGAGLMIHTQLHLISQGLSVDNRL